MKMAKTFLCNTMHYVQHFLDIRASHNHLFLTMLTKYRLGSFQSLKMLSINFKLIKLLSCGGVMSFFHQNYVIKPQIDHVVCYIDEYLCVFSQLQDKIVTLH